MPRISEQLWDAIYRFGTTDDPIMDLSPAFIANLIEFKMVTLDSTGLPQLTPYGEKCYSLTESGIGIGA